MNGIVPTRHIRGEHFERQPGAVARPQVRAVLSALGPVVYAIKAGDLVKIGHTTDLANRCRNLDRKVEDILGFRRGTYQDEQEIHARLRASVVHGREWYAPTAEVLAVVNEMRADLGLDRYLP